jgi:hypothetical protein
MLLQVAASPGYETQLTSEGNRRSALPACNLVPLVLIPSYFDL